MNDTIKQFKRKKRSRGFTLIEVLVSAILMVAVWGAAMQVFVYTVKENRTNQNMTSALRDLTSVLQRMKALDRGTLLTTFPPAWNDVGDQGQVVWQTVENEIDAATYTLIGGKKIGDTNSEQIKYLYENYTRAAGDPQDPQAPALLQVKLTVSWMENTRPMSLSMRGILE